VGLRHVDARWSRHEEAAHVTLVVDGAAPVPAALARDLRRVHPELHGVSLRRTGGAVPRALAGPSTLLAGTAGLWESLAGQVFHLSPGAFFQADPAAAERLHEVVRDWLGPEDGRGHLIDLYAGVGAFALSLADRFARVTAIEQVPAAVDDARRSAERAGRGPTSGFEVVLGDADLLASRPDLRAATAAVVDPPRRGLALSVVSALGHTAVRRLAYVACDPATAARDASALACFDFVLRRVVPVDCFANTRAVECVALFERVPGAYAIPLLYRADGVVAVNKPAVLKTHPDAPGDITLQDLVRRTTDDPRFAPVHRLDVGTSGPLLFAHGRELARLGEAFAAGAVHKEYVALVSGVPHKKGRVQKRTERGLERSRFVREAVVGGYGRVRVFPQTGRRHQVRRHMAGLGHPLLGDERYGRPATQRFAMAVLGLNRLFLHLERLEWPSPSGAPVSLTCPLAPELAWVLARLVDLRSAAPAEGLADLGDGDGADS